MTFQNCPFDVTPYDQSRLVKTPELVNINYTNQEFWSLKSRLVDFIKEKFGDDFNDFVESDLAIMLIENWAFIADTLSFKMDQIANEIFIDTVSEVDNAFRLALLVGFKPLPPVASRSLWRVSINNVLETDLSIPTPVKVDISTEDGPKTIELFPMDSNNQPMLDDYIIISSGTSLNTSVIGLEGQTRTQVQFGDGSINQFYRLNFGPVIWGSVRVKVDGLEWQEVDFFTDSHPRKEFRVETDHNYNAFVLFGNNNAGLIPSSGSEISITYRSGGGTSGNIVTGSVEVQRNFQVQGFDFRVPVTFRNYTKGEFGYNGDTIEDIKRKLPAYLRTQNRAVSGDDYQNITNQFATPYNGQIGKSTAVLRNHGCSANIIDLYILALEGDSDLVEATDELKTELQKEINSKKMITDYVCIKDGFVIDVDIAVDVVLDKFYKKIQDEIEERINRRISGFFKLNNWDYGKDLKSIDLVTELSDIKQITSTTLNFTTNLAENSGELVTTKFFEIIRPNLIDINFIYE